MKKIILFAAILFAGVSVVKAEGPTATETKNVTLTVNLSPIQSIEVVGNPVINYTTVTHYQDGGVVADNTSKVTVTSAGSYTVRIYAADLENKVGNSTAVIPAKTIGVSAAKSTGGLKATLISDVNLEGVGLGNELIKSTGGELAAEYNVTYTGEPTLLPETYLDIFNKGETSLQTFETTVYYTIAPN